MYKLSDELVAVIERFDEDRLREAGQQAVLLAVASLLWNDRLGATWTTSEVRERLGVTRQAVAKAVDAGKLIGISAGNTRRFPVWQFSTAANKVRINDWVAPIIARFREVYPDVQPVQIASWAMTHQPELDGGTPSEWMTSDKPVEPVLLAAERTATALAQ